MTKQQRVVIVDPNNTELRETALKLATGLHEFLGAGDALAVSLLAVQSLCTAMLHATTTDAEANIANITMLLDALKTAVMEHADCARYLAEHSDEPKEIVH